MIDMYIGKKEICSYHRRIYGDEEDIFHRIAIIKQDENHARIIALFELKILFF
jgi:hypothetical protein